MDLVVHKKAHLDYAILETIEAGLELFGFEVRSLRAKQGKLEGARVVVRGGEGYLSGASIPAWQPVNAPKSYDPERARRLLLSKKQIAQIAAAETQKGLTTIPLSIYSKGRRIKLAVGIARGKKKVDKRADLKARDVKRDIARTMKQR